jgi:hypothetical protein
LREPPPPLYVLEFEAFLRAAHATPRVMGQLMVFLRRASFTGVKAKVAKWGGMGGLVGSALLSFVFMFTVMRPGIKRDCDMMMFPQ